MGNRRTAFHPVILACCYVLACFAASPALPGVLGRYFGADLPNQPYKALASKTPRPLDLVRYR